MIGDGHKKHDVYINDQVTPPFQYYLMREDKTDITLTSAVDPGDEIISVSAGHGFTATGEYICIFDECRFLQAKVTAVDTDNISISAPSAYTFGLGAVVVRGVIDLKIDGSTTPEDFKMVIRDCTTPMDIDQFLINIVHSAEADDSKFGGIAEISKGLLVRKQNSLIQNLGNYKRNSDFKDFGAAITYSNKAGGGAYSTSVVFDLREVYGVVIRVRPSLNEIVKATVRDDLSSLVSMRIAVTGQYTQGEL